MTQEELAWFLGLDAHTVHSWETGRRALTATNTGAVIRLQHKLATLGICPLFLDSLRTALEADYVVDYILGTDDEKQRLEDHPFGTCLMSSSLSEMIAWPLTGTTPSCLQSLVTKNRRRGPVATSPILSPVERDRFFNRLQADADRSLPLRDNDRHHSVLSHQACFRVAWNAAPSIQQWVDDLWKREVRFRRFDHWSPKWLTVRSLAIARARWGDGESLSEFVAEGHSSDVCEIANLNYLAYWVGELPTLQTGNDFMTSLSLLNSWTGARILRHLVEKLDIRHPDFTLNLHSTAVLLKRPITRDLLESDFELHGSLRTKLEAVHDHGVTLSPSVSRELDNVLHALRLMSPSAKSIRERR